MFDQVFNGKRVVVTGHTGFKGCWLTGWLLKLGAEVYGYALDPKSHERLYELLRLDQRITGDIRADIRDRERLRSELVRIQPDFIFHLAAQPLVHTSYEKPVDTFDVNVFGTINLLEALRAVQAPCVCICITTDKCYENRDWLFGYRENDPMGGFDPYSASKGCAELVIASYNRSFFTGTSPVILAPARAGNVIGGGDWAENRIMPDCIRALEINAPIQVRNKTFTRPWQHVLEPLSGYLQMACILADRQKATRRKAISEGVNFGPTLRSNRTVAQLVQEVLKHFPGQWQECRTGERRHEASKLNLAIDKAFHLLDWYPVWEFETAVEATIAWYVRERVGVDAIELCEEQIARYSGDACRLGLAWATK